MSNNKLTKEEKKMINKTFWRWNLMAQSAWNYEKYQGMGYLYAMLPFIKEKYKAKEDQIEMAKAHNQFFNSHVTMTNLILGVDLAIENERGKEAKEMVAGLKTGLMGAFSGVGDTLFSVTISTIFGAIAANMAMDGSPIGCILWIVMGFAVLAFARFLINVGYAQGQKIVSVMGTTLKNITDASVILGMTVVGALIPSVVKPTCPLQFSVGETEVIIQDYLDMLMPGLLSVLLVAFAYWLLGRKKMTSTKLILITVVLSIVCYNLKLLA